MFVAVKAALGSRPEIFIGGRGMPFRGMTRGPGSGQHLGSRVQPIFDCHWAHVEKVTSINQVSAGLRM